jgi:hypothetical protein
MSPPVEARAEAPESSSDNIESEPPVPGDVGAVGPAGVPGLVTVTASTPPQLAVPLPSNPTPLPHTVTGALIGAETFDPPIDPVEPLAAGVDAGQSDAGSEPTPTALPQTVTGAVTGACASAVLPTSPVSNPPSNPVSAEPPAVELLVAPLVDGQLLDGSPRTATPFPQASTGAVTGAFTAPELVLVGAPEPVPESAGLDPAVVAVSAGWPIPMELPVMLTGVVTGALMSLAEAPAAPVEPASDGQLALGEPRIPMLVAHTVTGAFTGADTVSAEARPCPITHNPPTSKAPCKPRFIKWFMTSPNGSCRSTFRPGERQPDGHRTGLGDDSRSKCERPALVRCEGRVVGALEQCAKSAHGR